MIGELAKSDSWVVASVEPTGCWPISSQKVSFRDRTIWILPLMKGFYPAVAMVVPNGMARPACETLLMRFLSVLSWVERIGLRLEGIMGGNLPRPLGRDKTYGFSICNEFELSYLPEPVDPKAQLALALMREGRGLNHPGYAFLTFYRAIEAAIPNGQRRGAWIKQHVDNVRGPSARAAVGRLRSDGVTDVGGHLYESGRQAIAHAAKQPIIDPDEPTHGYRLKAELPIMEALAEQAIEDTFGVETTFTVYRKHLYELAGFKDILGHQLSSNIRQGIQLSEGTMVDIPDLSVRLRSKEPYTPFEKMTVLSAEQSGANVTLSLRSADGRSRIDLVLDFVNERLLFDHDRIFHHDDGTAIAADAAAELMRFLRDYFANGQIQIHNADTGKLISRKDAFLPQNISLNFVGADARIDTWKKTAGRRRQWELRADEVIVQAADGYIIRLLATLHPILS